MNAVFNMLLPFSSIAIFGFSGSIHCLGMCGPLVATCRKNTFSYFFARSISYSIIGFISGFFGHLFFERLLHFSATKTAIFIAVIAFLQIIFLFTNNFFKSNSFSNKLASSIMKYSPLSHSVTLGIITAILPCGFLYAALLMSASLANPLLSGLGMLLFSITTTPILWGGNKIIAIISQKYSHIGKYISIVLLLGIAVLSLMRGGIFSNKSHSEASKAEGEKIIKCH